jgi:hypothetical protein
MFEKVSNCANILPPARSFVHAGHVKGGQVKTQIDSEDILLLIFDAYHRLFDKASFNGVTRLEKLVFLLGAEGGVPEVDTLFAFRPYKFGPYSKTLYESAEFLQSLDLVRAEEKPYYSYFTAEEAEEFDRDIDPEREVEAPPPDGFERLFFLTETGCIVAQKLRTIWAQEYPSYLREIDGIVGKYGNLPLNQIIRYVYRRFPKMAEKSVHREAESFAHGS